MASQDASVASLKTRVSGGGRGQRGVHVSRVLFSALLFVILVSTSFLATQNAFNETAEDVGLSDSEQHVENDDTLTASRFSSRNWDWSELVSEDGLVDVIVTIDGFIGTDSKAAKAIEKVASSEKARIYRSIEGLSARITLETLDELLSLESSGILVYPDVTVSTTEFDSITQVGADQVWIRTDPYGRLVTGFGVVVAIIDTGVDYTHPDLGGALGPTYKVIGGYDFYNDDTDPMDDNGHGTHVAGVIAANGVMKGVAPGASILAYKVLGYDGSGPMSSVIAAIELATDPNSDGNTVDHADVISMSLGGPGDPDDPVCVAIRNAVAAGVVVVVAAGNDGPSLGTVASPGVSPDAVTVGAIDSSGVLASFSSRGMIPELSIKPEISAPGVSVMSTVPYSGTTHSSPTGYASLSGTSMATPHVSGGAALMLQMHPDWTPDMVKSALVSGASRLNESVWCAGSGGLWLPKSADSRLFFEPSIVSYGLAGGASQAMEAVNTGTAVTLSFASRDSQGLSADGVKVDVQFTNISTVAPTYATLQTDQPITLTLNVPSPSASSPEGYYDGEVRVSASGLEVRIPFGFAVLSILNVHVLDMEGREVNDPYGGVWLYSTPKADIALGIRGSVADPAPPASFLVPSGNYSVHSMGHQLIYSYGDPYVLSGAVSLKKLETLDVYLTMASARAFTIDLATDEGKPIYVKDYRVYCRYVGSESNISFHLVGSDYSITGSELFSIPSSKTVMISDTEATVGVSVSGFSYTSSMWDFMVRNWQHWYEYANSNSNEFYIEASTDLQYLLAWEFDGVSSATSTSLALDPSKCSVYSTKYDIPGELEDIWGDWGSHRSVGGDAAFYIRRDTDTSLNSFFSGMTRTTIVQGVFSELYFPWNLFEGYIEREFYIPDYDELVRADIASIVYLPNRNFLTSIDNLTEDERLGSGPFYPALKASVTDSELTLYHPLLRDQSGAKVGGMSLPSMDLYKNGQRTGIYQIAEHLARPDAIRVVSLGGAGTYKASITYNPTPQICSEVTIDLGFAVPVVDGGIPFISKLAMPERFVPGSSIDMTIMAGDVEDGVTVTASWREGAAYAWKSLPLTAITPTLFETSILTAATTAAVDLLILVTDAAGNYIQYTAVNASTMQIPVQFEIASDTSEIGYRNGDAYVILTGLLKNSLGEPLHAAGGVPIEMTISGEKIGMILDEYVSSGTHIHDGNIRFEWHFNPYNLFTGPNQTVTIDFAFDLGTYEPVTRSITLGSVEYYNPAPQISLLSPLNNSIIAGGQVLDLSISDDGAVEAIAYLDGVSLGELQSPWDVSTAGWTEGDHTLRILAVDDQLVETTASFVFHVDATDPVVDILTPKSGTSVPSGWTLDASVVDEHLSSVTYALDGGVPASLDAPFDIDMTGWATGTHTVTIEAVDVVGHVATNTTTFDIVDGTLVINLESPQDGSVIHSGVPIIFSVLSVSTYTSTWAEDGLSHDLGEGTTIATTGWIEGSHTIIVNSTDLLGGSDELILTITVDDTLPWITLVSPVAQSFVTPSDTVVIQVTDDNFRNVVYTLWGQTRTTYSANVSILLSNSPGDGPFTIDFRAIDAAGNEARQQYSFAMDSGPPELSVQGLVSGDAIYSGQVLSVMASDQYLLYVRWSVDSGAEVALNSPYQIETSSVSSGWHFLRVAAGDYSGKTTLLDVSLYVDTTPPEIVPDIPGTVVANSSTDLIANITDDYSVGHAELFYEVSEGSYSSVAMFGDGVLYKTQFPSGASLWDGMSVFVRAYDSVGNWADSVKITLHITFDSSDDGIVPGGDDDLSGGDRLIITWITSATGLSVIGVAIGIMAVSLALMRKDRKEADEDHVPPWGRSLGAKAVETRMMEMQRAPRVPEPYEEEPPPVKEEPIVRNVAPVVAKKEPEAARPRSLPLIEAIPATPMKIKNESGDGVKEEIDYGELIERELIIPGLKRSIFDEDLKGLEKEFGLDVDPRDPRARPPKSPLDR